MCRLVHTIAFAALLASSLCADDAASYKLQPLAYQNPDLTVDLGVGLWAYPSPLDYDGDGDMDLLVACPDKPSNGVYFFENPTQDASDKLPVFRAGVRIGPAAHYMMLSHVGDQAVIMSPGKEYRRDSATGRFNFEEPINLDVAANPNAASKGRTRANMWRRVDYDGDGDHDIVVGSGDWTELGWDHAYDSSGKWRNGPLHGYVHVIDNKGSDDAPEFAKDAYRLQAAGGDIDVYGWPSPNFADFDGDGDLDLLCGEFLDGFTYFQNVGTRTRPEYAAGQRLKDARGAPLAMHLQMITPTAVDWDGDEDLDLIVGDEDGRVALVENTGEFNRGVPVFESPQYFQQQADTLKFGALATPHACDWDGDGDEDIVCGNTAGNIGWFENLGIADNGLPKWNAPELLRVHDDSGNEETFRVLAGASGSIQGPCEAKWGYTTLSVADWDGDGDQDVIYNSILSRLGLLRNDAGRLIDSVFDTGQNETPPRWYWWQSGSSDALTQWRTTPYAIDFDGDDKKDLVMLDQEGFLTLRRSGGSAERIFLNEWSQPLRLNSGSCGRSGRVKLCVVDWDGDNRLDVLVNSENATWYRNCRDVDGGVILKKVGNLAHRNVAGHTSSPSVCDFDNDGKPDLLVGSENGRIYHVAHADCITYTTKQIQIAETTPPTPPRFPGLLSEEFVFKNAPFKECHASTICETTRGLVTAWFGGTKEGKSDVGIWTSYHDGQNWSKPAMVADGFQHATLRYPCWNPVLFQPPGDAPTLLFFKVGPSPDAWWGEVMVSYDRGRSFVDRRRLPEGIDGPVRCKPVLLRDGKTLLCGSSTEHDGWRVHFERTSLVDGELGGRWERVGPINDGKTFSAIQPTLLTTGPLSFQALCRTKENVIATTSSRDGGRSWSPLAATSLPNPNSGIDVVTLVDGRHLLIYNHLESGKTGWGRRGLLNLAISDDGNTWRSVGILEQEKSAEFSYPAMIQSADGLVHISYTWKRDRVKHVTLDPTAFDPRSVVTREDSFTETE